MALPEETLENRACQLTREFIGHALKVRMENPDYAQSAEQTCMIVGLELSRLALADGSGQQPAVLAGARKALQQLKLTDTERAQMFNQLAAQIMPDATSQD